MRIGTALGPPACAAGPRPLKIPKAADPSVTDLRFASSGSSEKGIARDQERSNASTRKAVDRVASTTLDCRSFDVTAGCIGPGACRAVIVPRMDRHEDADGPHRERASGERSDEDRAGGRREAHGAHARRRGVEHAGLSAEGPGSMAGDRGSGSLQLQPLPLLQGVRAVWLRLCLPGGAGTGTVAGHLVPLH